MRAVTLLSQAGDIEDCPTIIGDYVCFESTFTRLDGYSFTTRPDFWIGAQESVRRYLRRGDELARLRGDALRTEARCSPDGTIDTILGPARSMIVRRYGPSR
jgi:hypothetical protein